MEKKKELRWFTFYTSNSIDNNNWKRLQDMALWCLVGWNLGGPAERGVVGVIC
jgi:hypothetical protein